MLAHGDDGEARTRRGIGHIGEPRLAGPLGLAQEKAGGALEAGIGEARQGPGHLIDIPEAGDVGERDHQGGAGLHPAQRRHQGALVGGVRGSERRRDGFVDQFRRLLAEGAAGEFRITGDRLAQVGRGGGDRQGKRPRRRIGRNGGDGRKPAFGSSSIGGKGRGQAGDAIVDGHGPGFSPAAAPAEGRGGPRGPAGCQPVRDGHCAVS